MWLESFPYWLGGARAGPESFFWLTHRLRRGLHSYAASRLKRQTSCRAVLRSPSGATCLLRELLFCGLLWWLHFSDGNDFGVGAEFFVIAVGDVVLDVEVLQQSEAHVDFYSDVLR